jgi:hypothetical protein
LILLTDSRFGNILRVYAVLLLLAPFIIKLRLKYSARFLFFSLLLLIMSFSLIHQLDTVDFGAFNHPANILIGVGTVKGGPSVYHSLSFLLTGMYMASSLSELHVKKTGGFLSFYMVSVELIITFSLLGHFFIQENAQVAWKLFSSGIYRVSNMTAYYIIGIVGSVATITLFCFLIGNKALPKPIAFFLPLGTSSLISYTAGNMFLNIFGLKASSVSSVSFILIFFLSVILLTKYIDRMPCFTLFNNLLNFKYNRG